MNYFELLEKDNIINNISKFNKPYLDLDKNTLLKRIKDKLDEYLEFDSNILFTEDTDYLRIFGGAVRDSIANLEIHDIDIMVLSKSMNNVIPIIEKEGYKSIDLIKKDIHNMYNDVHCIFEPFTYINKNNKIIQLIRPSKLDNIDMTNKNYSSFEYYKEVFNKIISEVDLSCCGVSYDGVNLYEHLEDAILHCRKKVFVQLPYNEMNSDYKKILEKIKRNTDRIERRIQKLENRGWKELKNAIPEKIQIERAKKLDLL